MDYNRERVIRRESMQHVRSLVVLLKESEDLDLIRKIQKPINRIANLLEAELPKA